MILPLDSAGLDAAAADLRRGAAIVIPYPSPLPYGIAALTAKSVNAAKGRPGEQPCGILVEFDAVEPWLAVKPTSISFVRHLGEVEGLNLLVPLRQDAPAEFAGNAVGGRLGITVQCLEPLRRLLRSVGSLATSSANRTGGAVATDATAADEAMGGELIVLDGDPLRGRSVGSASGTIVEVRSDGDLELVRRGVHDRECDEAAEFLADLRRRFASSARGAV